MPPLHDPSDLTPSDPGSLVPVPETRRRISLSGLTPVDYPTELILGEGHFNGYDYFTADGGPMARADTPEIDGHASMAWWPAYESFPARWQAFRYSWPEGAETAVVTPIALKNSTATSPIGLTGWTNGADYSGTLVVADATTGPADVGSLVGSSSPSPSDPGSLLPAGGTASPGAVGPLVPSAPPPPAPSDAVRYSAQSRTDEEKAVARGNIGAAESFVSGNYIRGRKLILIGDSLVAASAIPTLHFPGVQPAISWYSNDQIEIVSPLNRAVNGVAVGGTDSKEAFDGQLGISQIAEAVNLDSDAVLIELGANDLGPSSNNSYTFTENAFATYYLRNVNALLAAGKNVIAALPVPGGSANAPGYGGPYNEGIAAITTRILSDTAQLGVRIYDPRPDFETVGTPGLYNDAFGASDGVHMTPCGALQFGKQVAAMFAGSHQSIGAAIGRGAVVNANPFNTSIGTQPALWGNRYGETLLLTRARTDAITTGERYIDMTADIGTMTIGSGNSGLSYTRKTSSDKLIVTHYVASGVTRATTEIRTQNVRGMKLIEVWPASNAGTITATAAQVKTAVEADATASAWVTVALVGDGSGLAANAPPLLMEVRTSAGLNVADASAPVAGDEIRACVELHKHPTAGWPVMPFFELVLRSNESSTLAKVESTQPTFPWPEPIGAKMTVATPWVPFVTGQTMHAARVFTLFFGTLSMSRLMVQKRTA